MNGNVRQRGDVTILDLDGKITIGDGDMTLRNAVMEAMNNGANKILLNMRNVSTIDSSGAGELVNAHNIASDRQARLRLYNLPAKLTQLFTITQLINVFEIYDNENEAVQSFQ